MKRKKILLTGICFLASIAFTFAQVQLSFNPNKGDKYDYRMKSIQTLNNKVNGQEVVIETENVTTYVMDILEKTKQEIVVENTYKDITFSMTSPFLNLKYDSKNPTETSFGVDKIFGAIIGKKTSITMGPDGSVKSISGIKELLAEMTKSSSSQNEMSKQIAANVTQSFSEDAIKNTFEQTFKCYPDKPVKVGDTWNGCIKLNMSGMLLEINTTYTLRSVENGIALIGLSSILNLAPGSPEVKMTSSGKQEGSLKMDVKTGITQFSELTQIMKISMDIPGGSGSISMDMVTKVEVSMKKID